MTSDDPDAAPDASEPYREATRPTSDSSHLSDDGSIDDPLTEALVETEPSSGDTDPDEDARRGEPLVIDTDAGTRIWATGWYRVKPRTFVHHELFFDPEQVACVYAEESYKSYLLRRSGRETEAARVGRDNLDTPRDALLDHSRSFGIPVADIDRIEVRSGSLLFKPKLVIQTADRTYEFRHWRRSQNTAALAAALRDVYSFPVDDE